MKIDSGITDQVIFFVAVGSTDFVSRVTGLSSSQFVVARARDTAAVAQFTTPTVTELSTTGMPGVYKLLLDEDMTIGSGNDTEEMAFHIRALSGTTDLMAPVTRTIELARSKLTYGDTLVLSSTGATGAVVTVNALAANSITASVIAADAIGASELAADAVIEMVTGIWGSTTGRPVSVTAMAAGVITGTVIATDAIDADALAADAVIEMITGIWGSTTGRPVTVTAMAANTLSASALAQDAADEIATNIWGSTTGRTVTVSAMAANTLTASALAQDAVDEIVSGVWGSTTGRVLTSNTNLGIGTPVDLGSGATLAANLVDIEAQTDDIGAAGAGLTAINLPNQTMDIVGNITGNLSGSVGSVTGLTAAFLDVAVSSRLATTGYTAPDNAGIAAIDARLPSDPADASVVAGQITAAQAAVQADIAALNDLSAADVNAEIVDALNVDTYAEPAQGTPGATVTLAAKLNYLYKAWRNRTTQTAAQYSLYNDDAATVDHKATFSDNAVTADRGEIATGP